MGRTVGRAACTRCRPPWLRLAQRPEAVAKFLRKGLRLLPRREVTAFCHSIVVNELRISLFRPTARSRIQLVGICAHCDGYLDACDGKKGDLSRRHVVGCFPIKARRGDRCVGQPVKRDVVEDVVPREPFLVTGEGARDEFVAASVVVELPGGKADR